MRKLTKVISSQFSKHATKQKRKINNSNDYCNVRFTEFTRAVFRIPGFGCCLKLLERVTLFHSSGRLLLILSLASHDRLYSIYGHVWC